MTAQPVSQRPASSGLVAVSYVLAVLLPIVGFVLGIALLFKRREGHGVAVLVIAVLVVAAFLGASTLDGLSTTTDFTVTTAP